MKQEQSLAWQAPLYEQLHGDGQVAEWSTVAAAQIVNKYKKEGEAQQLAYADLSPLPRIGVKGRDWSFLPSEVKPRVNTVTTLPDGERVACLGEDELLILPNDEGRLKIKVPQTMQLPSRDASFCFGICGERAEELLRRICVPLPPQDDALLQTVLLRISGVLIPLPPKKVPAFYYLADSACAIYAWRSLAKIAEKLGGAPIGWHGWRNER